MRVHPVLWFFSLATVRLLAGRYNLTLTQYMGDGGDACSGGTLPCDAIK